MALSQADVRKLIEDLQANRSECSEVEAKAAHAGLPQRLYEPLSALSNRPGGGVILFGVDESRGFTATGVSDTARLQAEISGLAADAMVPPIRPSFVAVRVDGKDVLAAEVPECPPPRKPCYYKQAGLWSGAYVRVGSTNRKMTEYEVYGYVSSRGQPKDDAEPVVSATLDDLDETALEEFVSALATSRPRLGLHKMQLSSRLLALNIAAEVHGVLRPTLAGLLVFGKYPQRFFPSLVVTFLRYTGADETTPGPGGERFLDNRSFDGSIPEMLHDVEARILTNMQTRALITGLLRKDIHEYPREALREALVNAVVHRDYSNYVKGAYIQVRMFSDRIEIQSPGGLFGAVTEDNIETEHSARNSVLMRLLEDLHLVENRGTGIQTMIRELRDAKLEPPIFEDKRSSFWVTFRNHTMMDTEAVGWLGGLSHLNINDRQRTALVYLRSHGGMANRDYQRLNSVDSRMATKELHGLVDCGAIVQHSARGGARYELAETLRIAPAAPSVTADQSRILEYARRKGVVTNKDVRSLLNVSKPRASYLLGRMLQDGLLCSEGKTKGMRYRAAR